jgi:hypothetical protein
VTVEASSSSLIEKTRATVTDASGQYRLPELTPGTYTLTFSLSGFATIKRENIDVTGSGVTTINADMRVGAVSETITVTGETPVVDIQTSTRRQVVLSSAVIESIPASRGYGNLLARFQAFKPRTGRELRRQHELLYGPRRPLRNRSTA